MPARPPARHSSRATAALRHLAEIDPALGALALWCHHRDATPADDPGPAAWTEGETIHYGPAFETLAVHEAAGLAAHHVLHIAFRHGPRAASLAGRLGGGFAPDLFNLAADAILNTTLIAAGHALPRPCITLDGVLAEALGEKRPDPDALSRTDVETLYLRLSAGRTTTATRGRATTGDGAAPQEAAERARAHALKRGFRPDLDHRGADPDGPAEAARAADWAQRLARALEAGRRAGTGLGTLGHRFGDLPSVATRWERELRGLLARAVSTRTAPTRHRPSRRWIAADASARLAGDATPAFEPGRGHRPDPARLAVGIDSSGSIDDRLLARFAAEVAGIARRTGAEIHALVFDTAVRDRRRLTAADCAAMLGRLALTREGGTDFAPVLAEAAALAPAAIVLLTDLDGPFGPPPGRIPVIWAVPPGESRPAREPTFGRVLRLLP
jgi:hypothetical protein